MFSYFENNENSTCIHTRRTVSQVMQHRVCLSSHIFSQFLYIPSLSFGSRSAVQGYAPSAIQTPVFSSSQSAPKTEEITRLDLRHGKINKMSIRLNCS